MKITNEKENVFTISSYGAFRVQEQEIKPSTEKSSKSKEGKKKTASLR